ncbi:hypothetical protein GCM10011578_097800 [Streptomyces fuscichromogenes]|uniref:Uncharacterized protein n=1 Tax=Streptomyces fuscichromogenes TaxID=1324013 RepID=A0A918CXR0_9ACTN|nr:hypothetical protein GCM10011578_097800 [Streptomyces fuscichromogenes]
MQETDWVNFRLYPGNLEHGSRIVDPGHFESGLGQARSRLSGTAPDVQKCLPGGGARVQELRINRDQDAIVLGLGSRYRTDP